MKVIQGTGEVPVIYTAHHASHEYGEFDERVALTPEQKIRFSDYGTEETIPLNGIVSIVAERSRALGDLNRDPDDPGRFQSQDYGKPTRHDIWMDGQSLSDDEKQYCQSEYYTPFHDEIIKNLQTRKDLTFVVAWDNTAHYEIGNNENAAPTIMQPFILSNRGTEGTADALPGEETSCDPQFLLLFAKQFSKALKDKGLPSDVCLNLVMKGGYITRHYSTRRNKQELRGAGIECEVQSFQVEYDTLITHNQITLAPNKEKIASLREAFSRAMYLTYSEYSQ